MSETEMNLFNSFLNYTTLYATTKEFQDLDPRLQNSITADIQAGQQVLQKYKTLKTTFKVIAIPRGGDNED
jgi:hypothetical protein